MGEAQVRRLAVLDVNNEIVGIVALGDLATRQSATSTTRCARSRRRSIERAESPAPVPAPAADHAAGAAGAAPSRAVRLVGAEGLSRQPGPAAGGSGRLLRAAVDRAAADPGGHRALAPDRPARAARHHRPLPRMAGAGAVERDRPRARPLPRQPGRRRLGRARHDDLLQLARLHGARERDVGDLPAPRRRQEAPLHLLGADPLLLHPLARRRPAAGDAGRRQPAGGRPRERRPVRPRPGRCTASRACCSTCSASPARSSC